MTSKIEIAAAVRSGLFIESFEHDTAGHFNVTAMRAIAPQSYIRCEADLTPQHAVHFARFRDHELGRIWQILCDPAAPWDTDPALAIRMPDDTMLFIDGTHRVLARWMLKCPTFRFYACPSLDLAIRVNPHHYRQHSDWGHLERDPTTGKFAPRKVHK